MSTTTRGLGAALVAALSFSLLAGAANAATPAAATGAVSNLSTTSVRLNGSVDPNGEQTNWYFDFGPTTSYGTRTAVMNAGSGQNANNVASNITGLAVAIPAACSFDQRSARTNRARMIVLAG